MVAKKLIAKRPSDGVYVTRPAGREHLANYKAQAMIATPEPSITAPVKELDNASKNARSEPHPNVQGVGDDEAALSKPGRREVRELRRQGDKGVQRVEPELPGLPLRRGHASSAKDVSGANRQQRTLRADKRGVADPSPATKQSSKQSEGGSPGSVADGVRSSKATGDVSARPEEKAGQSDSGKSGDVTPVSGENKQSGSVRKSAKEAIDLAKAKAEVAGKLRKEATIVHRILEHVATGFGYKIVDTGLFPIKGPFGKTYNLGTQLIDRLIPGDKMHLALDRMTDASPAVREFIRTHMTAPWYHRVWWGHDPLANLGMIIDKYGVSALPDWAFGLVKDSMSKAGIPLPGVQWAVHSGLIGDKMATEWLSMNVGEALSGGLSILSTYRLYKQAKNGQQIHKGFAIAGILFKTIGGVLSANPVVLLSAAADTAILVRAQVRSIKEGMQRLETSQKRSTGPKEPLAALTSAPSPFTGPSRAELAELQAKIDKIGDRILGHRINWKMLDAIPDREGRPSRMLAAFNPNTRTVELALTKAQDFIESFGHEALHALRELGVFTADEWALLKGEVKQATMNGRPIMDEIRGRYEEMYREQIDLTEAQLQDLLMEEAVAFMMGAHVAGKVKVRTGVAKLIDKIHQFLEAIINAAKGYGFRTGRGVKEDILSGKMSERPTSKGEGRGYGLKRRQYSKGTDLFPTEPGAEGLPQMVIPGAERISEKDRVQRLADAKLKPKVGQKGLEIGLFGDEKDQQELFNAPSEPAPDPSDMGKDEAAKQGLEDLAGNINLRNLNAPEDIRAALRDISKKAGDFIEARRGVQTNEMTAQLAKEMGMKPKELLERKPGTAFNAEEIFAARVMMMKSIKRLAAMAKQASTSQSLADAAEFMKAYTRHVAIQEQIARMTAEAGRALQQFKMMAGDTYFQAAERIIDSAKSKNKNRPLGAKNKLGQDAAIDLAQMIDALNDPAKINKFTREAFKVTVWDMIREFWINAILSGPRTHTTNIGGNIIPALWQIPETAVAATIGTFHGGEKVRIMEATARLSGLIEGTKDGLVAAAATIKTGEPTDLVSKLENHRKRAIPGVLGTIVRTPGTLLMAEDDLFKAMNYRAELHTLATRQALREKKTGKSLSTRISELIDDPPPSMKKAAHEAAIYSTFQSKLGPIGSHITGLRDKIPGGYLILPFIRTPGNLMKYAAERTPFGFLMQGVRENLSGKNGNVARDTQIARMALGSAIAAVTASYALAGMISGAGPDDPEERAVWLKFHQPYSIKVGGKWYSYQRYDPFALIIGVTADMIELGEAVSEADADKVGAMIIGAISNNLLDKTWLSGPARFIEAIHESERYGASYLRNLAGSVVPSVVNQINQAYFDPVLRDARTTLDAIKARLPYYSQTLPPRRNIFGEEIRREGALGPDILSSIYVSTEKDFPIGREMLKLHYFPSVPKSEINGNPLSPEQYDKYTEIAGKRAVEILERKIAVPAWAKRQPDDNIKVIKNAFEDARDYARAEMKRLYPELRKKPK